METLLYDKTENCPVCRRDFSSKKVRSRKLVIVEKQDDLNIVYKDVNPLYYQILVCPECGYTGIESEFEDISPIHKKLFDDTVRYKWKQRSYGNVRTVDEAIECYKLALLMAQLFKKPKSYVGNICLKLAWIYRELQSEKEEEYLKYALNNLQDAYQGERLDSASVSEMTTAYIVAELNRRFGNYRESIVWYAKVLDNPEIKNNRQLQLKTREQWRLAKEQHDQQKNAV